MSYFDRYKDISALAGRRLVSVEGLQSGSNEVKFTCADGTKWRMYHEQDCCEGVEIYDVIGDVADLQDTDVVSAVETSSSDKHPEDYTPSEYEESFTWTFYTIQTSKGAVTIRWLGESNGYYSEDVYFVQMEVN